MQDRQGMNFVNIDDAPRSAGFLVKSSLEMRKKKHFIKVKIRLTDVFT